MINGPMFQTGPSMQPQQVIIAMPQMPLRVVAAFDAMKHLAVYRGQKIYYDGGSNEVRPDYRDLGQREQALWNASMETLRLFITGEMDMRSREQEDLEREEMEAHGKPPSAKPLSSQPGASTYYEPAGEKKDA